jgi:hypothetical protein
MPKSSRKSVNKKTINKKTAKKENRKSPSESATSQKVGTIAKGNDGHYWVVVSTSKGVNRWVPSHSVKLNGLELLSEEYLHKNIGKTVKLHTREYRTEWPTKKDLTTGTFTTLTFIPSGKTKANAKGNYAEIEGSINFNGTNNKADFKMSYLQMNKKEKRVSTNLMNTEVFVEIK